MLIRDRRLPERAIEQPSDSDGQNRGKNPISEQKHEQAVPVQGQQKKSQKRNDYSL